MSPAVMGRGWVESSVAMADVVVWIGIGSGNVA